ncbi:MAG: metal-dependent transcriptional regulator [Actinomycetaceae bacterium]|nr:metal-dependent transcriptional regulator [Actinomycetaceae bacterium]
MSQLVDTAEMYLKAVFELEEEGVVPLRARLVERLEQSKPTVSETVARLERDGLMHVGNSRAIALTDKGRRQATRVMRKHRLAERLLLDVLGMPWHEIHEEACRWEHVMSDAVEARMERMLAETSVDPFGNPIPGEDAVGPEGNTAADAGLRSIKEWLGGGESGLCKLVRIAETLQTSPEGLQRLKNHGIVPGAVLEVESDAGEVRVAAVGEEAGAIVLDDVEATHLFVR